MEKHHILFDRAPWESQIETRRIRQNHHLIIPMDEEIEGMIHKQIVTVPLLDRYTARFVSRDFNPHPTYLGSINRLMSSIEAGVRCQKATQLQRSVAELTVAAIEQQIPLIKAGQITNQVGGGR
jgi:hypothetical protein